MALLKIVCEHYPTRFMDEVKAIPWMPTIELLAQIGDQASELLKHKLDSVLVILIKTLDAACRSEMGIIRIWCNCHWRHVDGASLLSSEGPDTI
jgi:hypothetical protein